LPFLKFVRALLADALAVFMTYTGSLAAFGANKLNLGSIKRRFNRNKSALLAHFTGLNMLGYDVYLFNDNLTLFGAYGNDFAFNAFGFTAEYHYGIAGFNKHFTHISAPPLKYFRSKRKDLHIILITQF